METLLCMGVLQDLGTCSKTDTVTLSSNPEACYGSYRAPVKRTADGVAAVVSPRLIAGDLLLQGGEHQVLGEGMGANSVRSRSSWVRGCASGN